MLVRPLILSMWIVLFAMDLWPTALIGIIIQRNAIMALLAIGGIGPDRIPALRDGVKGLLSQVLMPTRKYKHHKGGYVTISQNQSTDM